MLLFPFPSVLKELLAGQILFGDTFFLKSRNDFALRGYRRVVGAGNPAGVLTVHTGLADQHVIECVIEHMAHVENSSHIRRRDNDGVRLLVIGL